MNKRFQIDIKKACCGFFIISFLMLAGIFVSQPIIDLDFWWHLKTGDLIIEKGGLLTADPFNYTGDPDFVSLRERTILNGYWLWQVMVSGFYQGGGFLGIKLLKGLILSTIYLFLGYSLLRNRVRPLLVFPLLATSLVLLGGFYPLERPQVASFFFAALLTHFFVLAIREGRLSGWLFPVMALWGNLHGGVVMGAAMLLLFAAGSVWDWRFETVRRRNILLWCAGGIVASFLNPCAIDFYRGLAEAMGSGMLTERISEYQSTLSALPGKKIILLLWGMIALYFWALFLSQGRRHFAEWLVSGFLALGAVFYMRNIGFGIIGLLPLIGYRLEQISSVLNEAGQKTVQFFCVLGVGLFFFYAILKANDTNTARSHGVTGAVSSIYPQRLTEFLISTPLQGNIFNSYDWGGYLLWRLYPQYKLFIDGRGIDEQVYKDFLNITDVSRDDSGGRPEYEVLLEHYGISVVVMQNVNGANGLNRVLKYLLTKPEWAPVYLDALGYVLVKRGGGNQSVLEKHEIEKRDFLRQMHHVFSEKIRLNPSLADHYIARGELLGYMGNYDGAMDDFAVVRRLDPQNKFLSAKIRQVEGLRKDKLR